jgi:hypothetical protein
MRDPHIEKYFWVDALCINQVDNIEKSSQIPKMAQIYGEASNVRVWLGEEDEDSELALDFIGRILNLGDFNRLRRDKNIAREWAALSSLMRRPWFGRRWVVQEIALAKNSTIHCGKDTVSWSDFADAVALFETRSDSIGQHFK